jgi:hypothetical protein
MNEVPTTNDKEVKCSLCGLPIRPGRGVHGIGRKAGRWLHPMCKMTSDRSEIKYLRSHGFDVDRGNGHKSRKKIPDQTDGSNEETSQPGSSPPPMSLIQAQDLLNRIHSESALEASIHQLGNGSEYIIVLNDYFYIWSSEDWEQNKMIWVHDPLPAIETPQETLTLPALSL